MSRNPGLNAASVREVVKLSEVAGEQLYSLTYMHWGKAVSKKIKKKVSTECTDFSKVVQSYLGLVFLRDLAA